MRGSALLAAGGKVFMVSSLDPAHPGENITDGKDGTFWISTGLYPQEILLALGQPTHITSVRISSTCVRGIRFEACPEEKPLNFHKLVEGELENSPGQLQVREMGCVSQTAPAEFLRMIILSGWDDFCSVHRILIVGEPVGRRDSSSDARLNSPPTMIPSGGALRRDGGAESPLCLELSVELGVEKRDSYDSNTGNRRGSKSTALPGPSHLHRRRSLSVGTPTEVVTDTLEVAIPVQIVKDRKEPDAPRLPEKGKVWGACDDPAAFEDDFGDIDVERSA